MHHFLTYKNSTIAFTVYGNGPAVVLLHGFLENRFMWRNLASELSKRNRVICIDLLGHGESESLGYVHSMNDQATMIKFVLDHLNLRRYTMLGHSMGGYVALEFANRFKNKLKGLFLMNSTALPDSKEKKKNRDRAIQVVMQNHKTFVRLSIPQLFSEKNRSVFTSEISAITKASLKMTPKAIVAALIGMKEREDRTALYINSPFPMCLLAGKMDPVLDYNSLVKQVEGTEAELVTLPDGHMSHIENKNDFIATVKIFVNRCSRGKK